MLDVLLSKGRDNVHVHTADSVADVVDLAVARNLDAMVTIVGAVVELDMVQGQQAPEPMGPFVDAPASVEVVQSGL
jgi:hypothetical protein